MVRTAHSHAARADLLEIWVFIAQDDIAAADRQIDRIEAAITHLEQFPEIGHSREDAAPGLRVLFQDSYVVLYRYREREQMVIIERVVHGRRNLQGLTD
jgi:toxin ParE1/3/4